MKLRARLFAIIYTLSLLIALVPQATTAATAFSYNTNVIYHVDDDTTTTVTEDYTVTNNTARQYLTELKLTTPTETISGLSAAYDDGKPIPTTAVVKQGAQGEIKYSYQEITITFPRQTYGMGKEWNFSVTYKATGLVESKGSAHTVYVPSIEAGDPGDKYSVTVDAPQSFGTPHFAGAQSASGGISAGRQSYLFNKDDLVQRSLALVFGDSTDYNLNFNFPLANDSAWSKTLTVALPPDLNNQHTIINSLNPKPDNTRLDEDGNILADYNLKPHQHITVTTDVSGDVKYLEYDLSASTKRSDIPANLVQKYTKPTRYWPQSASIIAQAKKLRDDNAPVINTVKATYQFVIDKLSYNSDKVKFNIRQGADKALANPTNAVCLEYADLMIALLRAEGIPARMPVGYAYSGNLKESATVSDSLHAWVEAYVPGIGWMTVDPTWGEKFDGFGKSDMDHFAFAIWGEQDDRPAAVMAGNSDANYQYEKAALQFKSTVTATASPAGTIKVTRYVVLPFVSLDRIDITADPHAASDNNELTYGAGTIPLGSLAPGQKLTVNQPVPTGDWNQAATVKFTQGDVVLAQAKATVVMWPLFALTGLLFVLILATVLRLRSKKRRRVQIPKAPDSPR